MIQREFTHFEELYDDSDTLCIFGKYSEHVVSSGRSSTYSRDTRRGGTWHDTV